MGKSASKNSVAIGQPTNAQVQELAKNFNLSVQRINLLKQKYSMYRGRNNKINIHNYMVLYREFINANATDVEIYKSFNGFDADRDGYLDFIELLRAISLQANQNRTTPIALPTQPNYNQPQPPQSSPASSPTPIPIPPPPPPPPPPQRPPSQLQPQIQVQQNIQQPIQPPIQPLPLHSQIQQIQQIPLPIEPATLPPVMHVVRRQRPRSIPRPRSRSLSPLPYFYPSIHRRRMKIQPDYRHSYYHRRSPSPPPRRRRIRKVTVYVPRRPRSRSVSRRSCCHKNHHCHRHRSLTPTSSSSPSPPIIYERRVHRSRSYTLDDFY